NTKTMIFGVAHIVSYLSRFMALMPGDVIPTGTPPGVGMGQKPPVYLRAGDVLTLGGRGLGEQRQVVLPRWPAPRPHAPAGWTTCPRTAAHRACGGRGRHRCW
ncbi:MAG: fumarylacetoacetate hydrolase family protein, partial [Hydrogenophaga sp.]|nr:fumarylacetoacetate hydrolase family protein [Hydrogenophaga sp.]